MANDYISREAAVEAVRYYKVSGGINFLYDEAYNDGIDTAISCIGNEIPAADVVEVVRCKDCRYYYKDSDGYEMCINSEGYDHISADGFCAWAERRDDNGN